MEIEDPERVATYIANINNEEHQVVSVTQQPFNEIGTLVFIFFGCPGWNSEGQISPVHFIFEKSKFYEK